MVRSRRASSNSLSLRRRILNAILINRLAGQPNKYGPRDVFISKESSLTGAWSNSMGPRYSAWQLTQSSLVVFRTRSASATDPCGSWQSVQTMASKRMG